MNNQAITLYKQIHPQQCPILSKLGFKSLINLRFDDESEHQPKNSEISTSATQTGLQYRHLPINSENLSVDTVKDFADLIHQLPAPVMVFCGTGARAKRLYQSAVVSGYL